LPADQPIEVALVEIEAGPFLVTAAVTRDAATPAALARCLGGSGGTSCFSGARMHTASVASAPMTSAPVFNNNQPVLNSGPTVTLSWTPPASGSPISYVIEASNTAGGPANLANFNTGNTLTTYVAPDVPPGTYYVRIRALDASGAKLFVYTIGVSGKVKRIRNNPRVRIAPCTAGGKLLGDWVEAQAEIVTGEEAVRGMDLLNKKYFPWKQLLGVFAFFSRRERIVFAIRPA